MAGCTHLDSVKIIELPEAVEGCEDCLATGGKWMPPAHLPRSAATWAAATTRPTATLPRTPTESEHPVMRSLEPGEDWCWCFVDQVGMLIPEIQGETRIPPSPLMGCP